MFSTVFSGALSAWLAGFFHRAWVHIWLALGRAPETPEARQPCPWRAGFTRRWHTHATLAATRDRVDGHSARVAILILQLWPFPSADLLRAAITHDLGEYATGDMSGPAKRRHPHIYSLISDLERAALFDLGLGFPSLDRHDRAALKLCDLLDAYLWALHHRCLYVSKSKAWGETLAEIERRALDLGVSDAVSGIIREVRHGAS